MESLLKQIFDFYVTNSRFACTWVDKGSRWLVNSSAVLMQITDEKDTPISSYKDKPVLEKLKSNPALAYPENRFDKIADITGPFAAFVSIGNKFLSMDGKVELNSLAKLPMRHYVMLCKLIEASWNKFEACSLCYDIKTQIPVLRIEMAKDALWLAYAKEDKPEVIKIETKEASYELANWNDINKCYEKIRKENKMNLNVNTSKLVNDILGVPPTELKVDPSKAGKDIKVEAMEKPVEEPAKDFVKKQEAPKEVQGAPKEVPQEAPQKRTRKKADTTPVTDLTKVIDQLGGAVPEGLSAEEAQQAIRQLRDLMQKAASRIANISLKYIESTEGAVAKLAVIKAAL